MLTVDGASHDPSTPSLAPEFNYREFMKTFGGYFTAHNFQGACDYIDKVIQQFPSDPRLYLARADCLMNLKNASSAIDDLSQALLLSPDEELSRKIYRAKGVCHQSLEDIPSAVVCYKEAASRGDKYSIGVLATVGVIPKKTLSSSYPFDYNIPSALQETYEDT
jgi:tetratricopeptide (TPR) repeat protein